MAQYSNKEVEDVEQDSFEELESLLNFSAFPNTLRHMKEQEFLQFFLQYLSDKFEVLPELAHIMNYQAVMTFLYAFAGHSFSVPSKAAISKGIRDLNIFFSLQRNPTQAEVKKLMDAYSVSDQTVQIAAEKVAETLNLPNPLKK